MKPEREFDSAGSLLRLVRPSTRARATERTNEPFRAPSRVADAERSDDGNAPALARVTGQSQSRALASLLRRDAIPPRVGRLVDFHAKKGARSPDGRTDRIGRRRSVVGPSARPPVRPSVGRSVGANECEFASEASSSPVVSRRLPSPVVGVVNANVGSSSFPAFGWISFVVWETDNRQQSSRVESESSDFSGARVPGCPSASSRLETRASSVLSAREVRAGVVGARGARVGVVVGVRRGNRGTHVSPCGTATFEWARGVAWRRFHLR